MMATYFHGSAAEIQAGAENLQTLYLMNPNYVTNSYSSEPPNNNPVLFNPSSSSHFVGIPLPGGPHSQIHNHHHPVAVSRAHYSLWSPTANEIPSALPTATGPLSLSLSPHNNSNTVGSAVSNGGMVGSKYLKAAKELLDEVVNVGSYSNNGESSRPHNDKGKGSATANTEAVTGEEKGAADQLTTPQRHELQMKKAKLLNMLDEVEQRYRQYHTEMQVVVSAFEQSAGVGSAKSYTSLALQTISKQFRCLKDVIVSQIKATSKSLGEVDHDSNVGGSSKLEGGGVGSRLKFVDHQLRQQRALQQLGMMQHNAWRPQRGLPERAVSVLRAWLFEHFLHPYPKDSDKHILAKQTGLTRSQVSNWFINARVRLWKPMVEEMYLEEIKTQEQTGGDSETQTNAMTDGSGATAGNEPNKDSSTPKAKIGPKQHKDQVMVVSDLMQPHQVTNDMISNLSSTSMSSPRFTLIGSSSDMETLMARSPKKQRSMQGSPSSILSMDMEMKPPDHHNHNHHHSQTQTQSQSPMIITGNHNHNHNNHGQHQNQGFNNPYFVNNDMMGRFNPDHLMTAHPYHGNNNGVSLTLGLPHRENQQHNFIPNQGMQLGRRQLDNEDQSEFCGISMGMGQTSNAYHETIDVIQSRKSFAAHHLLHDFVQ